MGYKMQIVFGLCFSIAASITCADESRPITDQESASPNESLDHASSSSLSLSVSGGTAGVDDANQGLNVNPALNDVNPFCRTLSNPQSYERDGVYIWCDIDGVWSVFWRGNEVSKIFIQISSYKEIDLINLCGASTRFKRPAANLIEIYGLTGAESGIVQFTSGGADTEYSILINGVPAIDQVFIGTSGDSPPNNQFVLNPKYIVSETPIIPSDESSSQSKRVVRNPNFNYQPVDLQEVPLSSGQQGGKESKANSSSKYDDGRN